MAIALVGLLLGSASVTVSPESWNGIDGCFRISNGTAEVVVVPKIGRVMHYSLVGRENILWVNPRMKLGLIEATGYRNFGGDKLWPAPQRDWNWPPDPALDGSAWACEVIPSGVRMKSSLGKKWPLVLSREITLKEGSSEVKFVNQLSNWGTDHEFSVWQVTQVSDPQQVSLAASMNQPYRVLMGGKIDPKLHRYDGKQLKVVRHPTKSYKFGSKSALGILRADVLRFKFAMTSAAVMRARYPDNDTAQQIYTNPNPDKYVELEQLSPLTRTSGKEIISQTVTWTLTD